MGPSQPESQLSLRGVGACWPPSSALPVPHAPCKPSLYRDDMQPCTHQAPLTFHVLLLVVPDCPRSPHRCVLVQVLRSDGCSGPWDCVVL